MSADRANDILSDAQVAQLLKPSYAEDGVVIGAFHERNELTSVHNSGFHPFRSPIPFVLLRHADISDWNLYVDDEDWLGMRARRFPGSAVPLWPGNFVAPTGSSSNRDAAPGLDGEPAARVGPPRDVHVRRARPLAAP